MFARRKLNLDELTQLLRDAMQLSKGGLFDEPLNEHPRELELLVSTSPFQRNRFITGGWGGLGFYRVLDVLFDSASVTADHSGSTRAQNRRYRKIKLEVRDQPSGHEIVTASSRLADGLRRCGQTDAQITDLIGSA